MIEFRLADAKDVSAISALTCVAVRAVNSKDYSSQEVENACARFSPEYFSDRMRFRIFYVAEFGCQIIGQASYGDSKIHSLFVKPEFHRQGVGRELMKRLERAAAEAGVEVLSLSSSVFAHGFYQKLGYSSLREESDDLGLTYVMEKRLRQIN